jgi:hypothetical protein
VSGQPDDAEGRSSGNWHKVVDGSDAEPGQSAGPTGDPGQTRDAGQSRDPGQSWDLGQSPDKGPGRDVSQGRDTGQSRDPGQSPDKGPGRDVSRGRDAGPGRDPGGAPDARRARPPRSSSVDLTGDIQRWLIRSGARSMRRELGEQFRRAWTGQRAEPTDPGDIWNTATTEPPPDLTEAPECAWCPVCRAARRIRESGPGLGGQLAGAGDAVAAAVQEALVAFDAVLSAKPRTEPAGESARPAGADPPEAPAAGTPPEGPDHEPDDRD